MSPTMPEPADRPPSGCRYCGHPERGHGSRWHESVHWHVWHPPTDAQTKQRMLARRAETAEPFAGLPDSECGEHRPTGHRAWCYRDGEWCSPDAPCRGCELPLLRERAETAERQHAEALDQIATERRGKLAAQAAARRVRQVLARKTLLAGPQAEKAVRVADVEAALDAEQPSVCCDLHGLPCEPPSELCCRSCTEANHPQHPAGVRCVLDQPEETLMSDQPQLCNRGDGQPVSSRRVVLVGPDGTDRKRCGPYCDPCTDALLMNLKPTFTGGGAAYRIDREESR